MIFRSLGLLYIHIPRTGGTTFERMLGFTDQFSTDPVSGKPYWSVPDYERIFGWDDKTKIMLQHATLSEIEAHADILGDIRDLKKVAIVRNPYYRVHSLYLYHHKELTFDTFLDELEKDLINNYFYQPQFKFLSTGGDRIDVDFIIRFENIVNDIRKMQQDYNIQFKIDFDEERQKNKAAKLDGAITENQKSRIRNLYKKDFELFAY